MKLTINTSFQENASSPYLLILVDSEQLQKAASSEFNTSYGLDANCFTISTGGRKPLNALRIAIVFDFCPKNNFYLKGGTK